MISVSPAPHQSSSGFVIGGPSPPTGYARDTKGKIPRAYRIRHQLVWPNAKLLPLNSLDCSGINAATGPRMGRLMPLGGKAVANPFWSRMCSSVEGDAVVKSRSSELGLPPFATLVQQYALASNPESLAT